MDIALDKLAPRVVVAAVVGYAAWPSISYLMSKTTAAPVAATPEVVASDLSPTVSLPTRDPFVPESEILAREAAKAGPSGGRLAGGRPSARPSKAANPLGGLRLEATYLAGSARLAIINGRLYGPKEMLAGSKLTILDVLPYQVLLGSEGKVLTLAYSDTAAPRGKLSGGRRVAGGTSSTRRKGDR